ncbi:MAG TPA: hypothetical protein DCO80_03160 [Ornithinibacillus sp.]|uniref:Uncharacterized protein n=1 Tax=Ornithinibacillus bavariensis TaxID=545502 RepID=A0A920C4K1_9BACI|nr:hypothetical protein J43TS3_04070 [Ornithinibacillus bavariensis]HAM79792.1 hypothetical protein [Ornithinibacillus sp.]
MLRKNPIIARENKRGRRKSETIEEWLIRLGKKMDTEGYQKVRYSILYVTYKEIMDLKKSLKVMEENSSRIKRLSENNNK